MIKKITLHNFQSHKHSEFVFNNKVNVISGTSDSGKSSVVRAIRWVIYNRPLGNSFIRNNSDKKCYVTIETDKGEITRKKSKRQNSYVINGEEFTALGSDVPDEVNSILNLNDLNFHFQFDPHFLLMESAGKTASKINEVTNLEDGEVLLNNLNKYYRKLKGQQKYKDEDLETTKEKINSLSWVKEAEGLIIDLDSLISQYNEIKSEYENLKKSLDNLKSVYDELNKCVEIDYDFDNIERNLIDFTKLCDNYFNLEELIFKYNKVRKNIKDATICVNFDKIDKLVKEFDNVSGMASSLLNDFIMSLELVNFDINKYSKELNTVIKSFKEMLDGIDICPVCDRLITEDIKERIMKVV